MIFSITQYSKKHRIKTGLKSTREKHQTILKDNPVKLTRDFSEETPQSRMEQSDVFQVLKSN
jgi:hypothetical protein